MAERRRSIHTGHRQRVKDEFSARGLAGWPDHRVLELLLYYAIPQGDVNGLAHELVERFGSLAGVLDAAEEELCRVPGVGQHTAVLLKLIPAAGARYLQSRADLGEPVRRTEDAYALLEPYFFGARNEMIYLLALDGKNKPLGVRKVAEGSICAANINLRRQHQSAPDHGGGSRPPGAPDLSGPQPHQQPGLPLPGGHLHNSDHADGPGGGGHRAAGPPGLCGRGYGVHAGQRDDEVMPGPCPSVDRALT